MQKSIRILSILMAIAMLMGSFSVMGSAYTAYKDSAISYNDVDKPVFTVNQYASMAMDELDRMLSEEQLVVDAIVLTLDLTSVDAALTSVATALDTIGGLTALLGDVKKLNASALTKNNVPMSRVNTEDIDIFYALLKFLDDNGTDILAKYVSHSLDLGFLNALVGDYLFNVRELVMGLLYDLIEDGGEDDYDYFDDGAAAIPAKYNPQGDNASITNGFDILVQDLLNHFVLGDWVKLDTYFDLPITDGNHRDFDEYNWPAGTAAYSADNGYDYYGWFHKSHWVTVGLGETVVVSAGATAPAADYSAIDLNDPSVTGYTFIERLMQVAYNRILVPVLNEQTRPWLRETCGVEYIHEKMDPNNAAYVPGYDGEPYTATDLNTYASIFNLDLVVPEATVPAGQTFVGSFNNILGDFLDEVLAEPRGVNWNWLDDPIDENDANNNVNLFSNICSVARYVLAQTGDAFFAAYIDVPTENEIENMNDQQLVAFVIRAVLNASVDWMYIPESANTIADVGYAACEQLAWQDIPQRNYVKPTYNGNLADYNEAILDACLNILLDVAVYNLNSDLDMNPAAGTHPINNTGLLNYSNNYESLVLQVVCWALKNYGSALALDFVCQNATGSTAGLKMADAWADIDTLVNAIIPINGSTAWLNSAISNEAPVVKNLLFKNIVGAVTNLDASAFNAIFVKNNAGDFATSDVKGIVIDLVTNILDLLFPGVLGTYANLDAVLKNDVLGGIVDNLFAKLYERRVDLLAVILPVVCDVLGLSAEQEFSEVEIYLPERINTNEVTTLDFKVFNGSSGLNTAYKGLNGIREQDQLYKYVFTGPVVVEPSGCGVTVNNISTGTEIGGGSSVTARLGGLLSANTNSVIALTFNYNVLGEDGTPLTQSPLSTTVYTYLANTSGGSDEVYSQKNVTGNGASNVVKYYSDVFYGKGKSLSNVDSYELRVEPKADNTVITNVGKAVSINSQAYPFIKKGADTSITGINNGIYFVYPYALNTYTNGSGNVVNYERFAYEYAETTSPDEEPTITGNNGGVPNGVYTATSTISVGGTDESFTTRFHLYDDFGLGSAYSAAVSRNRQLSDYANTAAAEDAYSDYVTALRNAAGLVLAPKNGENFETTIQASFDNEGKYHNLYETYALALEDAIEALEPFAISAGYESLRNEIAKYSPYNYSFDANTFVKTDYEYDDVNYKYFGMRDFVPHTYLNFRDARSSAQSLVDRQLLFAPTPIEEPGVDATQYEYNKYLEALQQYEKDVLAYEEALENIPVVGAVEATYAQHMVKLTGDRLIYLKADISKLSAVYDLYNYTNGTAKNLETNNMNADGFYTAQSWEAYIRACDFAAATLAINVNDTDMQGHPVLRPSRVNRAISELVECWKKLVAGCDYSTLNSAIATAESYINAANYATTYTAESRAVVNAAYEAALQIREAALPVTTANLQRIGEAAQTLNGALGSLVLATVATPVFELISEEDALAGGYYYDSATYCNYFVPYVNTDAWNNYYGGEILLSGLGECMTEADVTTRLFPAAENVVIEAEPKESDTGELAYGTGTTITVYNVGKTAVLAKYVVIIKGEVTSDGIIDTSDATKAGVGAASGTWMYDYAPGEEYLAAAGDVNQDGWVDTTDSAIVDMVTNSYVGYINQSSCGTNTHVY